VGNGVKTRGKGFHGPETREPGQRPGSGFHGPNYLGAGGKGGGAGGWPGVAEGFTDP
jgi:hypothetical protein